MLKIEIETVIGEKIKTYVSGLDNFIDGAEIKKFTKEMSDFVCLSDDKYIKVAKNGIIKSCFEGNCVDKIKEFLITNIPNIKPINIRESQIEEKTDSMNSPGSPFTGASSIENNKPQFVDRKKEKYIVLEYIHKQTGQRASRTFIVNLHDFIGDEIIFVDIQKKLQKILGTNSCINERGDCGFNGDYTNDNAKKKKIMECIVENSNGKITYNMFKFEKNIN